jgi:hypothetical protein
LHSCLAIPLVAVNIHLLSGFQKMGTVGSGRMGESLPLSQSFTAVLRLWQYNRFVVLATDWTVRGSNPGWGEIFRTSPDRLWGPPSLLYSGYRVFSGGKAAGAWRWPLTPIYRRGLRKSRAIHLLPLWAFLACSRENFTFTFTFLSYPHKESSRILEIYFPVARISRPTGWSSRGPQRIFAGTTYAV